MAEVVQYSLEFHQGHQFRSDPVPYVFTASSDEVALEEVADFLDLRMPFNAEQFHSAGGKEILRGDEKIFPIGITGLSPPRFLLRKGYLLQYFYISPFKMLSPSSRPASEVP